jgi:hypothetical protein
MTKETKKMNKKTDGLGNNAKREEALVRLGRLEEAFKELMPALKKAFSQVQKDSSDAGTAIQNLDLVVASLISVVGNKLPGLTKDGLLELVKEDVKTTQIAQIEAESEQSAATLKVAIAEGKLTPADTVVNETDIIVNSQINDKGEVMHPLKSYLTLGQFNPGVKELLKDKKVGDVVTLPTGGSVTVLEIYNVVEPKETSETTATPAV